MGMRNILFLSIEKSRWWQIYLAALLVGLLGLWLNIQYCESWFQRVGAATAATLAFVAFFDPRQRESWTEQRSQTLKKFESEMRNRQPSMLIELVTLARSKGQVSDKDRLEAKEMATVKKEQHEKLLEEFRSTSSDEIMNANRSVTAQQFCILAFTIIGIFGDFFIMAINLGSKKC